MLIIVAFGCCAKEKFSNTKKVFKTMALFQNVSCLHRQPLKASLLTQWVLKLYCLIKYIVLDEFSCILHREGNPIGHCKS